MNLIIKLKNEATIKDLKGIKSDLSNRAYIDLDSDGTLKITGTKDLCSIHINELFKLYDRYPIEKMYLE